MPKYATIGEVKVTRSQPVTPQVGDKYYDTELRTTFIYYGDDVGWLAVHDDLLVFDGC